LTGSTRGWFVNRYLGCFLYNARLMHYDITSKIPERPKEKCLRMRNPTQLESYLPTVRRQLSFTILYSSLVLMYIEKGNGSENNNIWVCYKTKIMSFSICLSGLENNHYLKSVF
jgi:hypothetical protein